MLVPDDGEEMTSDRIPRHGRRPVYQAVDVQHCDPAELANAEVATTLHVERHISSVNQQ